MKYIITICLFVLVAGCSSPEPRSINYSTDQCTECKMNISDKRYGAEAVLSTNKQMVFDSPECMLGWYLSGAGGLSDKIHSMYVTDYAKPGTFLKAEDAFYAHGEAWASPMGLNAAAFSTADERDKQIREHGGEPLTYAAVLRLAEDYK